MAIKATPARERQHISIVLPGDAPALMPSAAAELLALLLDVLRKQEVPHPPRRSEVA